MTLAQGIFGCIAWADPNAFHEQTNNPARHVLQLRRTTPLFLESSGPTAALNCQSSVGNQCLWETPGGYSPQPEEVLMDWFNDRRNFSRMKAAWAGRDPGRVLGKEVAQWYPLAIDEVFGNRCEFTGRLTLTEAAEHLQKGRALQICLKDPGHFVAIVASDPQRCQFVIKDSWGGRWPQGDGFCQRMDWKEFETNVKPVCLVHYPRYPHGQT